MKLYAPRYYQKFTCIAGNCRHSCCIGWEIDVDKKTLKKYKKLKDDAILSSIERDEVPHFCLCADERCPHLNEEGLCRIILKYGDGCLCDICREHPRFYNDTARGREVGIGMACEEACRLVLTTDDFGVCMIGKEKGRHRRPSFDALPVRDGIYAVLADKVLSYPERLGRIADAFDVSFPSDKACASLFSSLEYMKEENRARFSAASPFVAFSTTPKEIEIFLSRTLAYFVFRHVTATRNACELRMVVGLCLLLERLLCSLAVKENALSLDAFSEIVREVSEELEYSEENTERLKLFFSAS